MFLHIELMFYFRFLPHDSQKKQQQQTLLLGNQPEVYVLLNQRGAFYPA